MKDFTRSKAEYKPASRLTQVLLTLLVSIILTGCSSASSETAATRGRRLPGGTEKQPASSVNKIELPHDESDFPEGPGRRIFISRCTVCHSLRYITMQPDFPEETWVKEVQKMRKTWGAHISDMEAKEIITYLVQIKGLKPQSMKAETKSK